jgi:peptidoglycan/xylan/chitin deacetylase (PgdA/CDA1 family)
VALTFDDGPTSSRTASILEILSQHQAQATFFLVGNRIARQEDLVRKEWEQGHEIGVHTWSHKDLAKSSRSTRTREITLGFDAVRKALPDANLTWWRAPYGSGGSLGVAIAKPLGLRLRLWDVDTLDWTGSSADVLLRRVLDRVKDGDVVLMHDHGRHTVEALDPMIVDLESRGYHLVSVSRLTAPVCEAVSSLTSLSASNHARKLKR